MLPSKILRVREQKKTSKSLRERLLDYLEKNLIVAIGAASTAFGLCVINAFLFHVEYSPTFDLQAWASIVFSATYVGVSLMLMFGILLFLPTFYIGFLSSTGEGKEFDEKSGFLSIRLLILSNVIFSVTFSFVFLALQFEAEIKAIIDFLTLYRLVIIGASFFIILMLFIYINKKVCAKIKTAFKETFSFLNVLISVICRRKWKSLWKIGGGSRRRIFRYISQLFFVFANRTSKYGISIYVLVTLHSLSSFLFARISEDAFRKFNSDVNEVKILFDILLASIVVCGSSIYLLRTWSDPNSRKINRVLSCFIVALVPIISSACAGNVAFIGMRVANATKIGNFYTDEITINKHGCEVLSSKGVNLCSTQIGDSYKICDAYMMSRIGTEAFIKINVSSAPKLPNSATPLAPNNMLSKEDAHKKKEVANNAFEEAKKNLRDVYLPSSDILGLKISHESAVFSLAAIERFMINKRSDCVIAQAQTPTQTQTQTSKIIPIKSSDLFEFDNHVLSPEGINELQKLVQEIDKNRSNITKIVITGFADQIGAAQYNLDLSQLRALTVENFLRDKVSKEIDSHVFSSRGFGSTRPKKSDVDCPTTLSLANRKACLADNRRVDVELVY